MTEEERKALESELEQVLKEKELPENQDFMKQLEIQDKAHNIKMKLNGVRPTDSYVECIGCGS